MGNENRQLMTIADFCRDYGVSRATAYREAAAGRLKMHKVGAGTRIAVPDAQEWASHLPEFTSFSA